MEFFGALLNIVILLFFFILIYSGFRGQGVKETFEGILEFINGGKDQTKK